MSTLILCDYDGELPRDLPKRIEMTFRVQRLRVRWYRFDKTRHGFHLIVRVSNSLSAMRCTLVQALLGSDWKREAYNSRRALARNVPSFWRGRQNVLYKRHFRRVVL